MEEKLGYNRSFEIDIEEMNILESALRLKLANLLDQRASLNDGDCPMKIDDDLKKIRNFLGSIHNQKIWYRPKKGIYVSG